MASREFVFRDGRAVLDGTLELPPHPVGVVVFAHGTGSGRDSPRNRAVATALRRAGLATARVDLSMADDPDGPADPFDLVRRARRLEAATAAVRAMPEAAGLPVGWFGSSTGAAIALVAAAGADAADAVVSRGGRLDLVGPLLGRVTAPTLLVVGADDPLVLEINRAALGAMRCPRELVVVPGAGHLFEEPGALDAVGRVAAAWFVRQLQPAAVRPASRRPRRGPRPRSDAS